MSLLSLLSSSQPFVLDSVYSLYSSTMPNRHVRIVEVGEGKEFTSIEEARVSVASDLLANERALIKVWPGSYTEQVGTSPRVDMVGATGNPDEVIIQHTCPTGFSPLNTNGGPCWIGGLTIKLLSYPSRNGSGVYAVHHRAEDLTIFEKIRFEPSDSMGAIGMDGGPSSHTWIIDSEFINTDALSDLATNMHGFGDNTEPLTLVFDNVDTNGRGVNYNSLDSGQVDKVYVSGGNVAKVNLLGASTHAYIDPAISDVSVGTGVTIDRTTTLPLRPLHGKVSS